jgi:hypothetical protein
MLIILVLTRAMRRAIACAASMRGMSIGIGGAEAIGVRGGGDTNGC